jgi:protein-S-isoprenylcysteine O-methyltransferase Ste14
MKPETQNPEGAARGRASLAGEHALTDVGQIALFIVFLGTWVSDSFVLRYSLVGPAVLPLYVRVPLCVAALAASLALALPAVKSIFGDPDRMPGVENTGVFARVRHPMYLGSWLLPVGMAILTGSLASAGVCVVILVFYLFLSRHEEKLLLKKHGSEYRDYMARVPMFFPFRLRQKKDTDHRAT